MTDAEKQARANEVLELIASYARAQVAMTVDPFMGVQTTPDSYPPNWHETYSQAMVRLLFPEEEEQGNGVS